MTLRAETLPRTGLRRLAALAALIGICWGAAASAERRVDANEPVVISDDIMERTTAVESATEVPPGHGSGGATGAPMGSDPGGSSGSGGAPGSSAASGGGAGSGGSGVSDPGPASPDPDAGKGKGKDDDGGTDSASSGKTNHGHGNNADGVDSSNPGQGKGGPNAAPDPSCMDGGPCVDDESKGGGSAMSKGKKE